jgi:hypothetical protein
MMDQASACLEWHIPAHVELQDAELEGLLALGPTTGPEAGDCCMASGNIGMTFARWMAAYTSDMLRAFPHRHLWAN